METNKLKLLIIETEIDSLNLLMFYFEHREFDVKSAENIEDAIKLFINWKPDVIITTNKLSRFNVHKLVKFTRNFNLDVLALVSGYSFNLESQIDLYKAGFHKCLEMPFDIELLEQEIKVLQKFKLMGKEKDKYNFNIPRILLVDDDVQSFEYLEWYFSEEGFEVKSTVLGKDALELFKYWSPNIIISDFNLPDIDGNNLIKQIRELNTAASKSVLAILLTGLARLSVEQDAYKSGYDKIFDKASSLQLINEEIKAVIRLITSHLT